VRGKLLSDAISLQLLVINKVHSWVRSLLGRIQWRSLLKMLGAKMFNFRLATAFCLEYLFSKHKSPDMLKSFGGHDPLGPPWLRLWTLQNLQTVIFCWNRTFPPPTIQKLCAASVAPVAPSRPRRAWTGQVTFRESLCSSVRLWKTWGKVRGVFVCLLSFLFVSFYSWDERTGQQRSGWDYDAGRHCPLQLRLLSYRQICTFTLL